jgi:hypothetical protein
MPAERTTMRPDVQDGRARPGAKAFLARFESVGFPKGYG